MEKKREISQYRERLDMTLRSQELASELTIKALVKNQILSSSQGESEEYIDNVVEKRTEEVSKILHMLKSASVNDERAMKTGDTLHGGWKLQQDTDEHRIMYREGPEGTPFHSLLVEGYVDGPVDVCLCISWESALYKKWWPQTTVPSFKVLACECLQKVRVSEQISLVRMKVSWPLSAREAIVHYFVFEYLQDDLIVVVLSTISDVESIDKSTHGFTKEGIPEKQDVVRIDLEGGFALQKVTSDRSYFRTIMNMDIKLDFVPPSFINFVSRQLIGGGFRLYQKEVANITKGDEDYCKALKDPLYSHIRKVLYSGNIQEAALEPEDLKNNGFHLPEVNLNANSQGQDGSVNMRIQSDDNLTVSLRADEVDQNALGEIEEIKEKGFEKIIQFEEDGKELHFRPKEEETERIRRQQEDGKELYTCHVNKNAETNCLNHKEVVITPEVEQALGTLEKAISFIREKGINLQTKSLPSFTREGFQDLEKSETKDSKSLDDVRFCSNDEVVVENSKNVLAETSSNEPRISTNEPRTSSGSRHIGPNSHSKEGSHNRIAPASPEDVLNPNDDTFQIALSSSVNETTEAKYSEQIKNVVGADAIDIFENKPFKGKKEKRRLCCTYFWMGT